MSQHPLMLAWILELQRKPASVAVAVLISAFASLACAFFWPTLVRHLSAHLPAVAIAIAMLAGTWVHGRRAQLDVFYERGWLAALPLRRRTFLTAIALRSLALPALVLALIGIGIAVAELRMETSGSGPLVAAFMVGEVAGSLAGWFLPRRSVESERPPPQRAIVSRSSARPTFSGLSYWPLSQAHVWLKPRSTGKLLLPVMLAMPLSISGNAAIAILAAFVLGIYLVVLLLATAHVAKASAEWLRTSPLGF